MDGIERTEDQIREANELYWESETSVNRIADRLGLSKGSLYAAIEPLASESICPLCSAPLVYNNRTALEKGQLQCSSCGTEFSEKAGTTGARSARVAAKVAGRPAAVATPVPTPAPPTVPSAAPVAIRRHRSAPMWLLKTGTR